MEHLLNRLGYDPRSLRSSTMLAGSASGAFVARIRLGDSEFVLKTATEREAAFYRAGNVVPVRVPHVVAADDTCLLLEALTPVPPAKDWPASRWHEVARQLGELHHPRVMTAIGEQPWLRRPAPPRSPDATSRAFWTKDELATPVDGPRLPPCLIHGDLHAGNLLTDESGKNDGGGKSNRSDKSDGTGKSNGNDRSGNSDTSNASDPSSESNGNDESGAKAKMGGELVWADWQEVGIGTGPEDLALLWQRAEADGADPPRAAMLATYAEARGIPYDDVLRKAANAAEVRLLLLDWPPFLINADPARAAVMRKRLHLLRQRQ
ncbi:hypothetical protein Ais01nite_76070 [Asanoa ishikariensis]|uniref:Phosphotransferase enzyme family protein n=1 Tax=Asanoa ishikariensis TaxID=137265 RepID=A0A1H3L259_9ACTN|nr:phosphotransferase [Asanoa ishikariensis]GIF69572.1 hypothetical protein Ais01nite_76070 [Asanoa ishikariensis]SDY57975.1 Phosphotransferase enzyme family protein [Asanoa ishikariensis]